MIGNTPIFKAEEPKDYTALLTSIKDNTANLIDILAVLELVKTNTNQTNTKLDSLIALATSQLDKLTNLETLVTAGNASLVEIVSKLSSIDTTIQTIKNDILAIKTGVESIDTKISDVISKIQATNTLLQAIKDELDIEISVSNYEKNNGTINYIQRDTLIWDSENGVAIDTLTEFSINGIDWNLTAPAGDVFLGFLIPQNTPNTHAQDTFQLKDCEGNPIGTEQEVIKVIQLGKQVAKICNATDITAPIVAAINTPSAGKKLAFIQWVVGDGEFMEIPAGKFSTVSMHASKGEFRIVNGSNDFMNDLIFSGQNAIYNSIEISADGIGSISGSEDVPISFDTRANGFDLDPQNNSFNIECLRAGVLNLELYK